MSGIVRVPPRLGHRTNCVIPPAGAGRRSDTETPTTPVIWEWRDNDAWLEQALAPIRHTGADGC